MQKDFKSESNEPPAKPGSEAKGADDLAAFLSRTELSESSYKEFPALKRAAAAANKREPASGVASPSVKPDQAQPGQSEGGTEPRFARSLRLSRTFLSRHRQRSDERTGSVDHKESPGERAARLPDGLPTAGIGAASSLPNLGSPRSSLSGRASRNSSKGRWALLDDVLGTVARKDDLVEMLKAETRIPGLLFYSLAGGVGRTSLLANLGRALSFWGERVLLSDTVDASHLALFFGAQESASGEMQTFSMPDNRGGIDVLTAPDSPDADRQQATESRSRFAEKIHEVLPNHQRLLMDASSLSIGNVIELAGCGKICLIPLVPDLNCALSVTRLEKVIQEQETGSDDPVRVFFLLNKFKHSLALHRDLRSYLEERLGNQLLPITVRRSDVVPEALAQGSTVFDYDPKAAINEDYLRVAEWLRNLEPPARSHGEGP